jgi:hypothetical protein
MNGARSAGGQRVRFEHVRRRTRLVSDRPPIDVTASVMLAATTWN